MISTGICRWLFLLISLSTWTKVIDSKEMRIICYYTNWSVYRPGQAKFSPQNINPYLCTHLVYAFGGFTKENTLKPFDKYQDIEKGGYAKFTGLKTYNKNLKTLLAIGGWNEGSSRFSPMVASAERRKELVKNAIKFLRQNHFDGLDLDWEYPTFRDGGKARDRDNYAQLVKELREEFERESEKTGRPRLLLTMAVPAGIEYINKGYDVPKLTKYLDWMNILSYDYHSAFEPAVNHHAPLYPLEEDNEYNYDAELNIDYTIKHYLKHGADPSKLVLGIPTYGRSYTLFNPDATEIGAPADGPGDMGEATRENGYLAYYEICEYVKDQDWDVEDTNPNAMGPIAYKDNQWVGYDDENIVRKKAEYVAENSLGGIMFWAIDNDDFRGNCHGKPYPLIEAGKEALINAYGLTEENLISPPSKPTKSPKSKHRNRTSKTTTTEKTEEEEAISSTTAGKRRRIKNKSRDQERSSTSTKRRKDGAKKTAESSTYSSLKIVTPAYTTPAPPATPDLGGAFKCEDEGFFPHPKDCKKYFWCLGGPGDTGIIAHQFTCPAGLYFNKAADSCDYSQNVFCNKKLQKSTTSTTEKMESSSTEPTTSQKPTPNSLFSTSRVPPKITAATSKTTINFRTTTESIEDDDEYEDEEDESNKKEESEEDPRVIKELLDLIKKAGGIEELEKQLNFGKDGSQAPTTSDSTTPSAISKSLYERVLSKTSKNTLNALKKTSNRNSGGPQGEDIEETKDKTVDRGRPQYKTLTRQRPSTEKSTDSEPDAEEKVEKETKEKKLFRPKSTLEYVNIRRPKASTTTEASDDDGFSRNKILGELDEDEDIEDDEDTEDVPKRNNIPQYVNIRRQRPSTTETSGTSSKFSSIRRSTVSPVDPEADDNQEDTKYNKIVRRGPTSESTSAPNEPTTSLRYQTIRRGTTTTPTPVTESDDEAIRRRSTTEISLNDNTTTIKRSTTSAPVKEETESTSKSQTISKEPSTQSALPTSEQPKSTLNPENQEATDIVTETDLPGTTLPQEKISSISTLTTENLISSSTYRGTTESNSDATNTTSSNRETTQPESQKKKRPVLFQPRPFSVGVRSTTPEPTSTTVANSKVSPSTFKFRLKQNSSSSEPSTTTVRPRTRVRYTNVNRIRNEDTEQEEKIERTEQNKPVRTRKRPLTTTESPVDHNEEYNRKYRPAELADLSSLTAADLNLRGGEFVSKHRRRRPVGAVTSTTTTTERILDEFEKTGSKTLTLARKTIEQTTFGKSRRVIEDQLNASSDQSATRKIGRRFRSTTPKTTSVEPSTIATEEKPEATPRTRKIIRKFRPRFSSTTAGPEDSTSKNVPSFRQRQTKNTTTASEESAPTSESPLLKLFKPRSRFDVLKNATASPVDREGEDESSNEHTDVLNGEEGENIKLSESNIRESSHLNTFGVDEKPGKGRSIELSSVIYGEKVETTTEVPANFSSTEPSRILRTRKIIRKLGTAASTEPSTFTTTVADTNSARKRVILRRLRPTTANDLTSKDYESSTKKYYVRTRGTTQPTSDEVTEEIKSRRVFKPSFTRKTTERVEVQEEEEEIELNRFRSFRPTTDSYASVATLRYNSYTPPVFDNNDEDVEDEVYDDDSEEDNRNITEDDDMPKYTIYTTSSIERTHKFESNTNFNDEDEEDIDSNLKANKSITSQIFKTAVNNRKESETIINEADGEEVKEKTSSTTEKYTYLRRPQKDRSTFVRQRLALGKEEFNAQSHQDSLKTRPGYRSRSTTVSGSFESTPSIQESTQLDTTTLDDAAALQISGTTESVEVTSLILNAPDGVEDENLSTTIDTLGESTDEMTTDSDSADVTISPPLAVEESTKLTVNNLTESTTEYHRRSTLRSVKDRPRLGFTRRTTEVSENIATSTTESGISSSRKSFTRNFGKSRSRRPTAKSSTLETTRSTTPLPLNKLLYRYSTTETTRVAPENIEDDDEEYNEDEEDEETTESFKPHFTRTSTARVANKPVDTRKVKGKPTFTKVSSSTESLALEDLGVDAEAVKNRNKNLFSKRKMNTPVVLSSTTPSTIEVSSLDDSDITMVTTQSSIQTDSTDPNLTTLHHVFAEVDGVDTTTESMSSSPTTSAGKVERLIEVNRIVEVKTKQAKAKNHRPPVEEDTKVQIVPTVDKIGEISRITLIKIVDGNNETIIKDPESNEIGTSLETTSTFSAAIEVAKVEEIPAAKVIQNVNLKDIHLDVEMDSIREREERKFEIFGESKVANNKDLTNRAGKPVIIDGISHINVVTPKPLLVTEASTISLQGLFQTEKPHLNPSFTSNDEVLETGRSEFVNVRIIDQDKGGKLGKGIRGNTNFIPVRVLPQDEEESTIKAHVMEISPKPDSRTIKIIPIKVEMSRNLANGGLLQPKQSGVKT